MSDETTNTPPSDDLANTPSHPPVLRREAVYVMAADPRRFAAVAAVTALAGVAIGFALALLAQQPHQCTTVDRIQVIEGPNVRMTPAPPVHSTDWKLTWLGVQVHSKDHGAMVMDVFDDTPAEAAGLKEGDVIRRLEGSTIHSASDLVGAIRMRDPGETVTLEVLRDGDRQQVEATLSSIRRQELPR